MRDTIQRRLVLDAVHTLRNHPTADEIYESVSAIHPSISKGTVYRNLNNLTQEEEIYRVSVANAPDRFDFTSVPHPHFKCDICGRVFDFDGMEPIAPQNLSTNNFDVKGCEILFTGECSNCKAKKS